MTIAILENEKIGLGFGVFAGLLMDMGYGSVIGFHAIVLGVLGFFIGLLAVNLVKTNVLTSLLCTAAAVFAVISSISCFSICCGATAWPLTPIRNITCQ